MKIIAVGMNYALHNKELGHTHENKEPVIFLKPDSAILKDGKPFIMYPCFGIVDNVLLSICQPDRISEVVVRKLMAPDEIQKMEQLTEDDNPVLMVVYMK